MSATKHNTSGIGGSPYQVPPEPNRWPSIGLAVGVHALLLAFLVVGINWQNNQPVAVEAEVWDMKVQSAAPPAPTPPPQVEPEPEPEPEPETPPPPAPRVVEPPKVEQPAPPKQPDIALEREKKRKEELKRKEEERVERERELAQQKREDDKKAKALAEKKAQELAKKEEAEKKELAKLEEAEKKKKAEKEKAAKEKAEKAETAKLAKLRADEMKRMMAGAGNPGSTGTAEKSTAPRIDKGYIASIATKIKSNTTYPGSTDVPGNPEVEFKVEQLPTGEIISVRKTKSSGIPAFDDAVERGINKSSPLPKKKDGTVERSLPVSFKLKDLN
jgi:colicin import membrane protein